MTGNNLQKIKNLEQKNASRLHLTANENQMSNTAASFLSTKLSERYFFGGGKNGVQNMNPFILTGLGEVAELAAKAERALEKILSAKAVNLNCLSGLQAMTCAMLGLTKPGDLILTVDQQDGGHFATKSIIGLIGRRHGYLPYDMSRMEFNLPKLKLLARKKKITAVYLDASYYIKPHNLRGLRDAVGPKVLIIYDASHTLGLIMGGKFQRPFAEGADVICGNTHKTLPGPQKGLIAFKDKKLGEKTNQLIGSCLYSSVHTHHLIALAITILEMEKYGPAYASQTISNAQALGRAFVDLGYDVRSAKPGIYTFNHQIHVFLDEQSDKEKLFKLILNNNISVNFDRLMGKRYFIRLGAQETTRLGMKEKEMRQIAGLIDQAMRGNNVKPAVSRLLKRHKKIRYSFDK